jgi:Tfp pilus assembly protein PilX
VIHKKTPHKNGRRGVAIIAFVAALLVIGSFALWLFQMTATTALSSLSYYYGTSAFYAAESGIEMAMRELNASPPNDFDSDGTIGTISDNGNPSDDPALTTARVFVTKSSVTPPLYEAEGRPDVTAEPWSDFRRVIEIRAE